MRLLFARNGLGQLADDVACAFAHQLGADEGVCFCVHNKFHEAPVSVCNDGPGIGEHCDFRSLYGNLSCLCFFLCHAYGSDFRSGVDTGRHDAKINSVLLSGYGPDAGNALSRGHMGKLDLR